MLGGLFKSIGSSMGFAAPKAPQFVVPAALPGVQAPSAGALAEQAGMKLAADAPVAPANSTAQLLRHLLNEKEDMLGATRAIAHGLPPQEGVKWAVDACKQVEAKLPPEHREAILAADALACVPNAANRQAAAVAAAKVGLQSPAGLAAKAASMVDVPDAPPIPGAGKAVPALVTGAVVCAAALSAAKPKKPELERPILAKPELPDVALARPDPAALAAAPPPPGPGSPESARNANAFLPFIAAGLALAAGAALTRSSK